MSDKTIVDEARVERVASGRVYGWKAIGAAIGVGEDAAQKRARWEIRLPVEYGHKGPFAYVHELLDWEIKIERRYVAGLERAGRASRMKPQERHLSAVGGK